jgi:hypothetical protein
MNVYTTDLIFILSFAHCTEGASLLYTHMCNDPTGELNFQQKSLNSNVVAATI